MKIALVHDHLAQDGGAERVLLALQQIWPEAPTYALVVDPRKANVQFHGKDIRTSFLQHLPFGVRRYQWFFPLMPTAVERFDLMDFDIVLSSTASFAKGVITRPDTLHICYCHTPTRYLWSDTHEYIRELGVPRMVKWLLPFFLSRVRLWDRAAADRVDLFIANSCIVQERIQKYYRAKSEVIYPPVDIGAFSIGTPSTYYLTGGRLVPYKRFDLVVEAFNRLGRRLKIFGTGPEEQFLRGRAKGNIEFVGRVTTEELNALYQGAIAFINPQVEDFGITMVEAMACGRPVIAYNGGGAREIVIHGKTGEVFLHQTSEDLSDVVIKFQPERYDPRYIRTYAEQFSLPIFQAKMKAIVEAAYTHFTQTTQ